MMIVSLLLLAAAGVLAQSDTSTAAIATGTSTALPAGFTKTPGWLPGPNFPEDFLITPPIGDKASAPGGRLHKYRLGPFFLFGGATLPGFGSVDNPCKEADCHISAFEADLEYADGTVANIDTGVWLHHMVLSANGVGRSDIVCPSMRSSSRIFAAGNERATTRIDVDQPFGIFLRKNDTMNYILELMSESTELKLIYLTIKLEVTENPAYKESKQIWLDSCGCCGSSVPAQSGAYQLRTPTWTSTLNGDMLIAGGHTHDGGEKVELYKNGEVVCTTRFMYAMEPGYIGSPVSHGDHNETALHISNSGGCRDVGELKVGDQLYAIAYYNATKYPQYEHDGKPHPVMGIANIWVGLK